MKKRVIIFLIMVMVVPSVQAGPMTEEELALRMPVLFTLHEGGVEFILRDGIVIANLFVFNGSEWKLSDEVPLAEPEVVKAFLKKTIEKGLAEPPTDPPKEAFFDSAISSLGNGALKDPTAQPLLKRMVFDSKLPWDIRSTAMDTLAAIDFEGNLEMFFEVVKIYGRTTAYRIIARYGTPAVLDRLEKGLDKVQYEDFKAMVRELIADRRAELAGEEKKK